MPVEALIVRLEALMADAGWNQATLAGELRVSSATLTRAMQTRAASPAFITRAEKLLNESVHERRGSGVTSSQELQLLQKMYGLLVEMSGRLEALAAESRSGRGIGKGQQ